ncbi:prolipoprotein diacylglyceryl transferase [Candidatus Woesearchaeota archaeon]|nr:prolipoprotein diacylglyceryl transferase [Candidatus Woesearchaeota archaeon]
MFYPNINPVLLEFGPLQIRYYGLFYALGFIIAYFLISYLAKIKQLNLTKDDIADFMMYEIIGIVLGARLIYVIVYNPLFYLQNPLEAFAIWHGGLSFHGGLTGAIVAGYLFCKKKKIEFYDLADIAVVPIAAGLALGRIGNFINAELYGRITEVPWCIDYSKNQFVQNLPSGCRHPSQIYSSIKNLAIFAALWVLKGKKLPKGFLFWSFVTLYGLFRTIVEFFRQPDEQIGFLFNYFTMGQLLSFPLFLLGIYMLFRLKKKDTITH